MLRMQGRASLLASLFQWEGWVCGVPPAHVLGQLGRLSVHGEEQASSCGYGLVHMDELESTRSAAVAAHHLAGVEGFEVPSWEALSHGLRPRPHDLEDREPGGFHHGWQHEAASRVERHFRDRNLMSRLAEHEMALLQSQSGPKGRDGALSCPASFLTRIDFALFRVLLLRRLRLPLPLSFRLCRCGPLDSFGHHHSVFEGRCVGTARICSGERSCQSLPRNGASHAQHDGQGHGLGCSAGLRLVAHNWPSTRLWCPRYTAMAQRGVVLLQLSGPS